MRPSRLKLLAIAAAVTGAIVALGSITSVCAAEFKVLHALGDKPMTLKKGVVPWDGFYVPSTPETVRWGALPNADSKPVLSVPSGSVVTFDSVSHEGMMEDQGKNPIKYFGQFGVRPDQVLPETQTIATSSLVHDFDKDAPHILTGPVVVEGAKVGDVLKVEILGQQIRVPYGIITNRQGKGALPGEFPEEKARQPGADATHPELYGNVSVFTPIHQIGGKWFGTIKGSNGVEARYPVNPFSGVMGVAVTNKDRLSSAPPGAYAGNLDLNELTVGATLYIPILVDGALFYTGDPHFAEGDGEVALNAVEGSLRSTFRLTALKPGDPSLPMKAPMKNPFAETPQHWVPIGLNPDLNEAMKDAVRQTIQFLNEKLGMDRAAALAYSSAAVNFQVTQVVDGVKGVHALIRKSDFRSTTAPH
jgi:acetamidase/formamidase